MEHIFDDGAWIDPPDLAIAHPSLLPPDSPYLRIERTFIFLDLTGFTEYTRDHGAERAASLLTVFRLATRTVASRRGVRVAKWMGDGAMLVGVEPGPSIALGAQLIAQFRNAAAKVRVGIATGAAVLFEGDDYIGDAVNLAARLCSAAQPGEVLAVCDPPDLPYWVHVSGETSLQLRGIGQVDRVLRIEPALATWTSTSA